MTKYELIEKTEINGDVWYYIKRNGWSVSDSWTKKLDVAQKMFDEFKNGGRSEPINKILNSIEVNENETN